MATPAFEEIVETFEFLEDWEDRYRHVIDMGKAMPPGRWVQGPGTQGRWLCQSGLAAPHAGFGQIRFSR